MFKEKKFVRKEDWERLMAAYNEGGKAYNFSQWSAQQIQNKIQNCKEAYKKVKDKCGVSGYSYD